MFRNKNVLSSAALVCAVLALAASVFACCYAAGLSDRYEAQLEALNWGNFLVANLVPVTLGNIVGGMVFVGLPLYLIHARKIKAEQN